MPLQKPSAPKLSFKSKQHSEDGAPSVSIRFNASSVTPDDDDDERDIAGEAISFSASKSEKKDIKSGEKIEGKDEKSKLLCRSSTVDSSTINKDLKLSEKSTLLRATTLDFPDIKAAPAVSGVKVRGTLDRRATTESAENDTDGSSNIKAATKQTATGFGGTGLKADSAKGKTNHQTSARGISKQDKSVDNQSAPTFQTTTSHDDNLKNSNGSLDKCLLSETSRKDYIPQMSQVSQEEEKSLFLGIKNRLQDRFHDNISAVIEKIEEISGDSKIGEALERHLRKSDSLESNKSLSSAHSGVSGHLRSESLNKNISRGGGQRWSRENSVENDVFEPYCLVDAPKSDDCQISTKPKVIAKTSHVKLRHKSADNSSHLVIEKSRTPSAEIDIDVGKSRNSDIEFEDDFYAEPAEDYFSSSLEYGSEKPDLFGKSPPLKTHRLSQSTSSVPKQSKFSLHSTLSKTPPAPGVSIETSRSVPVSMSALLSHTEKFSSLSEEPDEAMNKSSSLLKTESREYYDIKDDNDYRVIVKTEPPREPSPKSSRDNEPVSNSHEINKHSQENNTVNMGTDQKNNQHFLEFSPFPVDITQKRIVVACVFVALYIAIPLPSFISGWLCGAVFATLCWLLFQWLTLPPRPRKPFVPPNIHDLPPLTVPKMKPSINDEDKFKGWMNELHNYDPDNYHISNTKSVFVQLEGTNLRLQTPRIGVAKRAMWNDPPIANVPFIKQRHFDLSGSKVDLLPPGLVRKRLWSKKYPICIVLKKLGKKKTVKDTSGAKALGFEVLPHELCEEGMLFLFARTGREKEEWYRRFVAATQNQALPTQMAQLFGKLQAGNMDKFALKPRSKCAHSASVPENITDTSFSSLSAKHNSSSLESGMSEMDMIVSNKDNDETESEEITNEQNLLQYLTYMSKVLPPDAIEGKTDNAFKRNGKQSKDEAPVLGQSKISPPVEDHFWVENVLKCDRGLLWANAAISRLFLDFLREQYWAGKVKEKIEKKLSKIHVPYFIDTLTVTDIDLGAQMPIIQRVSSPYMDDRGLWLDIDIAYGGGFQMTLETKVNLMKLKKTTALPPPKDDMLLYNKKSAVTNSDEEDSAESSTDEETNLEDENILDTGGIEKSSQGKSKKLLKIVDKIAASKYFQQATENKYVKRAMEGVSKTKLILTVEIESCVGTVALNIPPPPTDRIWYGFRENPKVVLSAKPRIGQRDVNVTHITEWIEKKLLVEFQRVLVLPNLDDLHIPFMFDPARSKPNEVDTVEDEYIGVHL